ncbi:hypothetical protein SNE26_20680 [Mucilaginibacter sp. cycad4]|uniref:hypothetical protein n=1 Tax=Mucilaginibacter sp. cycad4 TaxID=3342096 RepID=UPI002AAAAFA0|nr:hypothetical protein [Mucilaginibacter gossypii]WPU98445.1 hypothetical protein SNE26_20680 [Mucilaginibacter gossypii]
MPIQNIKHLEIPTLNFDLSDEYWTQISAPVNEKYGPGEIKNADTVQDALKLAFVKCSDLFMAVLASETRASFYLYIQHLLENTIDVFKEMLGGAEFPVNKSDFANIRRTLRIVLEQASTIDLKGNRNFMREIAQNRQSYIQTLDKLLYLGYQAFIISQQIAQSQLFPRSVNFDIDEQGLLGVGTEPAYKPILDYLERDIPKHDHSITLYHTITDLIEVWKNLGVEYGEMTGFLAQQIENPNFRFAVLPKEKLYEEVRQAFPANRNAAISFYDGLTVSRRNVLSFEDCILRSQDINRIMYRPLVEVTIDNEVYLIAGFNRWLECLSTLTTNALPWGHVADEWRQHKPIKDFVRHLESTHDDILEDAAVVLLKAAQIPFDKSVKSLRQHKGNNFPIGNIKGIGEIDLIFADTTQKILYIVECKHNKSRFDYFNWKRDYTTFKSKYETQLNNKITFAKAETERVLVHLEVVNEVTIEDKADYIVNGIFLINAPTLYMYDAKFPTLTLHNLQHLLGRKFVIPKFALKMPDGNEIVVEQPYFTNLALIV